MRKQKTILLPGLGQHPFPPSPHGMGMLWVFIHRETRDPNVNPSGLSQTPPQEEFRALNSMCVQCVFSRVNSLAAERCINISPDWSHFP